MFSKILMQKSIMTYSEQIERVRQLIKEVNVIVIGAGAGLSTSAGLTYSGTRFQEHFADFIQKYKIKDMYSGGFYPFETLEEYWAWWSRHIIINRYETAPTPIYEELLKLVSNKDYFVLTTNVDHQFQLAGFDKKRLFYTQGDYGLWQCSEPCCQKVWDNEQSVRQMVELQQDMRIPTELIPHCPICGKPMITNLRCDDTFVQDKGWYDAYHRYEEFLQQHKGTSMIYLELGVGNNTPVIIKYPFWKMTKSNPQATYICINKDNIYIPKEIAKQAICIQNDIGLVLEDIIYE